MALGLLLGWLALRDADWGRVRAGLGGFSPTVLVAAVLVVLLSSYMRALRWRMRWVTERVSS